MGNGGEQKPGAAMGSRDRGYCRGRRSGVGQGLARSGGRRSSGGYGLAGLAVLALWGAWSLGVVGCTGPGSGYGRIEDTPGSALANMRLSPGEISRLERNAHYYKLMGRPELGLKELELALQQNPDNLQIANFLAQNYEGLGKFEAARQLYQEALTRHGSHPAMANNLCFSYYQEGRWQEAETCFRQTLARDPGNVAARNNLGLLYCRLGRQDEARRLWQEAENGAAADAKMSQVLAALGMPERAVYAQRPEPAPPAARVTQAPTSNAAASRLPAPVPAKDNPPAQPVTPKESAGQLATKPAAPTPGPVAARPRPEARKQAAAPKQALAAEAPGPAPQAEARPPHPPRTTAELVNTAVEVRNGTHTKNLAHQTRALLHREGFTVAGIGDHQYSDAAKTTIYYRPGAERVAWAVARTIFPEAGLAPSKKLKKGMDILVLLRRDLLENSQFMARLADGAPPAAPVSKTPAATDKLMAAKTEAERPAAGLQEPLGESRAKAGPGPPPLPPKSTEVAAQPLPAAAPTPLTAADQVDTAIEVRNGTWTKNLARQTRSLLHREGFTVARIGNHVDFGAAKTIIYYRPEAEKVARAVGRTVFPGAGLEPSMKLKKGMDIKILLGADLLERPQLMARLVAEAK
ncbi:MAG: tetratricopeptide repeat protein [Deltaproteobacteria bacterium]|nr:tetratricopeptide repeat protein [Deltaproteobacteria bacterium]